MKSGALSRITTGELYARDTQGERTAITSLNRQSELEEVRWSKEEDHQEMLINLTTFSHISSELTEDQFAMNDPKSFFGWI